MKRSGLNHQNASIRSPNVTAAASTNAPDQKSVAVLPFVNLSDDKGSEYFSDGVSEELLTVLQKIPGLHVAARTSAFSFKGKNATAQEIGQKLGVAHLVDGSVRKSGDAVRIAARLTRADTGEELWSENYTRDLKDVFAVQTELAQTIVEQLRGRFDGADTGRRQRENSSGSAGSGKRRDEKCRGASNCICRAAFMKIATPKKVRAKLWLLTNTRSELDPGFALAWAGVARTHIWLAGVCDRGRTKRLSTRIWPSARDAVARALSIEPNLPDALLARAWIETNFDFNWSAATQTVSKAMALAPADPNM